MVERKNGQVEPKSSEIQNPFRRVSEKNLMKLLAVEKYTRNIDYTKEEGYNMDFTAE